MLTLGLGLGRYNAPIKASKYLLDEVPNAELAWSDELLSSTYTGDCLRVRRASDDEILDIGFANDVVDKTTLETFCDGTDGYLVTWYGQVGGINLTSTNTLRQPKIVTNGVYLGGLDFRGNEGTNAGRLTVANQFNNIENMSVYFDVTLRSSVNSGVLYSKDMGTGHGMFVRSSDDKIIYNRRLTFNINHASDNALSTDREKLLVVAERVGDDYTPKLYRDNEEEVLSPLSQVGDIRDDSGTELWLGQRANADSSLDGLISEAVFYSRVLDAGEINSINTI